MSKKVELPRSVRLRSYQVGFGDCFLLTLRYEKESRHVLFDFGSTAKPKGASKTLMTDVANDIASACKQGAESLAVVASHRHEDHIGGFNPGSKGRGPGAIIRALKPKLVLQPWTEDPKLDPEATAPTSAPGARGVLGAVQRLGYMQRVGALAARETAADKKKGDRRANTIHFMGSDAIKNRGAVENLMTMAKNEYLSFGAKSGLTRLLPGVKVDVLGPPTLAQTETILKQRQRDDAEFWKVLGLGAAGASTPMDAEPTLASPFHAKHHVKVVPPSARWFVRNVKRVRRSQLLQIVRVLDDAMNNTSLILVLRIGALTLLFPGDAQIENWEYALKGPQAQKVKRVLRDVRVYKVGHHGSTNATPQSLWELFERRSPDKQKKGRLESVMSSMAGKHHAVPRKSLVDSLKKETTFHTTERMTKLYRDVVWKRNGAGWARE